MADESARAVETRLGDLAAGERRVVVSTRTGASPRAVWAILSDPARHAESDASGMVLGPEPDAGPGSAPIRAVGDVFRMRMHAERMGGDYLMVNTVTVFEPLRRIAWTPAREGYRPLGFQWCWSIEADGEGSRVELRYDWDAVTHPKMLARSFPPFPLSHFQASVRRLAERAETAAAEEGA
ncbi:MAG: SRPBCC family protein [Pseudoclavibacter sp.]|nr:SRPBCC family protein [Pseudoclavibacter sp.]